ncbi:MAG: hypothetical protein CMA41_05620 [Euryarchaeota archaeon]|jgi:hypothetical protein|nr:hypothetical protein [Euryarchaeota archaeon]MBF15384.1 hypothetical protein [Euryarchaeota archaeon]
MPNEKHFNGQCSRPTMEASPLSSDEAVLLEQGRIDFDTGRYWHAHEAWEDLWNSLKRRNADKSEVLLVQGLIQTAALLYNHQRQKSRGVTNQWEKLIPKLSSWKTAWGFDIEQHVENISIYVEDVGIWQQTYENMSLPVANEASK